MPNQCDYGNFRKETWGRVFPFAEIVKNLLKKGLAVQPFTTLHRPFNTLECQTNASMEISDHFSCDDQPL
jgi:hypothetical protein